MPSATLKPSSWYCDECGELIESAEVGRLEWKEDHFGPQTIVRKIRIVHDLARPDGTACRSDGVRRSVTLDECIGRDGLQRTLDLLGGTIEGMKDADGGPMADVTRRLHVPAYEEARRMWRTKATRESGERPKADALTIEIAMRLARQRDGSG